MSPTNDSLWDSARGWDPAWSGSSARMAAQRLRNVPRFSVGCTRSLAQDCNPWRNEVVNPGCGILLGVDMRLSKRSSRQICVLWNMASRDHSWDHKYHAPSCAAAWSVFPCRPNTIARSHNMHRPLGSPINDDTAKRSSYQCRTFTKSEYNHLA